MASLATMQSRQVGRVGGGSAAPATSLGRCTNSESGQRVRAMGGCRDTALGLRRGVLDFVTERLGGRPAGGVH